MIQDTVRRTLRLIPSPRFTRFALAVVLASVTSVWAAPPAGDTFDREALKKLERTFQRLAETVAPSVVAIETHQALQRDGERWILNSQGSGFVYGAGGLIVTNHHVIDGADRIRVTLADGRKLDAVVVQFDPRSDLAMIRVNARDLRVAPLGDLGEVRPGQWVFTAGNPFGLANEKGNPSVSFGTVEAIGRTLTSDLRAEGNDRYYGNLIETKASINPGNSGGPMFDLDGRVVGISTAMVSRSGVSEGRGFAIPISTRTRHILETLARGEVVRYGYLGVSVTTLSRAGAPGPDPGARRGAQIRDFAPRKDESPAGKAGLRKGDVIVRFDGATVATADDLIRLVGGSPVGAEVEVVYVRQQRRHTAKIKLAERVETALARNNRPPARERVRHMDWRGLVLVEPTDALLSAHNLSREDAGLYVFEVPPASNFYRRGLRQNTMIMRLDGHRVRSLDELLAAERAAGQTFRIELANGRRIVVSK